jgi:hypothetical protein
MTTRKLHPLENQTTNLDQLALKGALLTIELYCDACEGMCNTPPEGQRPCDIFELKCAILSDLKELHNR